MLLSHGRTQAILTSPNRNILKLNTISVPSRNIVHWANVCFVAH